MTRVAAAAAIAVLLHGGSTAAQVVYPSAPSVPANLLRISIVFPAPPVAGETLKVWLSDRNGAEIEGAFYPQRLWSTDGRTLTVYLDPGRVKTGLKIRSEYGPILRAGESVQLRLGDRVLKTWSIQPVHEQPIEPRLRALAPPLAGSRTPLSVTFEFPIDRQDVDLIAIQDPDGRRADGVSSLARGERTWTFRPARPWSPGRYVLRLNAELEDPEGNRLTSSFEVPLGDRLASSEVKAPFVVR